MNIVMVNDNAHVNGGAAKVAIMEAAGLAERGHRVFFLCAVLPVAPELLHPNIEVVCSEQFDLLANPRRVQAFAQGLWNIKAERMAETLLSRLDRRNTIIHLHTWSRGLSPSVISAAIDSNLPTVCTLHDFALACPTGTFFLHGEQRICHLEPMGAACIGTQCDTRSYAQKLWRVGRQMIQQNAADAPSGITDFIVHSSLAREVMQPFLPAAASVHPLTLYVESTRLAPAEPGDNESFVYLGRLVREKGVAMLARCAAAEHLPVVFVGAGPLADEVRAACPEAHITGWVDPDRGVEQLRQARVLIFPSLWYETLGLVVAEAAANGIASIVADSSAARELVIDGVTGLHFRGGDEADLRAKMRHFRDPAFAADLGAAAYDHFWSSGLASRDAHLDGLEAIYASMLRRRADRTSNTFDLAEKIA